jgi:ribosomal protein L20A (L18A)
VEEKLVESFEKDGNMLRIGMSGLVLIEDRTAPKKSARAKKELEATRRLLQELEEKQKTQQQQVDAQKAAEVEKEALENFGLFDMGNQEEGGKSQTELTDGMQLSKAGASTVDGSEGGKVISDPTAMSKQAVENLRKKLGEIKKGNLEITNAGKGKASQSIAKKLVEEVLAKMRAAGTNETIKDRDRHTGCVSHGDRPRGQLRRQE